jgi:hypothetical protein
VVVLLSVWVYIHTAFGAGLLFLLLLMSAVLLCALQKYGGHILLAGFLIALDSLCPTPPEIGSSLATAQSDME